VKIVLKGDWPTDPVELNKAKLDATLQLIPSVFKVTATEPTPEKQTTLKYLINWIHLHLEEMDQFDLERITSDEKDGGLKAFADLYHRINAHTEGDLERCCKRINEFPLMLGYARALYSMVATEIDLQTGGK